MYRLCMIATIPLATGNKLNCFISASGMLAIVWHCVLLFCCFFCVCFLLIFYMLINHLLKKKLQQCLSKLNPIIDIFLNMRTWRTLQAIYAHAIKFTFDLHAYAVYPDISPNC